MPSPMNSSPVNLFIKEDILEFPLNFSVARDEKKATMRLHIVPVVTKVSPNRINGKTPKLLFLLIN